MRIVRDTAYLDPADRGAAVAIGNFDGVHLGHRVVIDTAREIAGQTDAPLGVMTFEPHPREVFAPDAPPFRLMNAEARANRLAKVGVQMLYEVPFNRALAGYEPDMFAEKIIHDALGLTHVVVGEDFYFGRNRAGTAETLGELGAKLGFGVTISPILSLGETEVSSTAIRKALTDGDPRTAAKMLGHWHRIEGKVIHGEQRGRELGYPTANMSIEGLHPPKFGVYAVKVDVLTGPHAGTYNGAASIGIRPMFGENLPNCETFLFDFSGDLYDEHLSVALVDYLRPELKFDSLEALITRMGEDCAEAGRILADV
ncbi:bifunctional riboflavin kinase/FAD synthetase [Pelagovum pacificum]|uniref:Riboflavin biosynthesis protein n=1 Tax=Pelagovum pacificum TaxID=2588711 RepID=A0A5C5GHV3_9RHOB|nr:bifunctional riboflavin kinase/FAD synthetase [Pelagovum pacificum]QQA43276.1 bifunctional riboflavin kinase/FAD synthetase [Pelagovum pacificum]TNY34365.1 bifunctional riboflavin kinase/FAD synthetase [Pelagovum pacificum]